MKGGVKTFIFFIKPKFRDRNLKDKLFCKE